MFGESVTRLRRVAAGTDRYGSPTFTESSTAITGAAFAPGGSVEPVEVGRAAVITSPALYFRSTVDLLATDRVIVRGTTYTVEGDPAVWVSPYTGETRGVSVSLKAVTG
jgi:hypothetical protein